MWIIKKLSSCWRERRLPSMVHVPLMHIWRKVSPWQRRYGTEADFWNEHIDRIRHIDHDTMKRVFPVELQQHADTFMAKEGRIPEVLEIGSGPLSLLSSGSVSGCIKLTAVDPLADTYRRIAKRKQWNPMVQPIYGTGEHLERLFGQDVFDVVYASNALDHAENPRNCLAQMVRVLRGGGLLMVEGYIREGSLEGWAGLHQFDLIPEGGELVCYGRSGVREVLTANLGLVCKVSVIKDGNDRKNGTEYLIREGWANWLTMVYEKERAGI